VDLVVGLRRGAARLVQRVLRCTLLLEQRCDGGPDLRAARGGNGFGLGQAGRGVGLGRLQRGAQRLLACGDLGLHRRKRGAQRLGARGGLRLADCTAASRSARRACARRACSSASCARAHGLGALGGGARGGVDVGGEHLGRLGATRLQIGGELFERGARGDQLLGGGSGLLLAVVRLVVGLLGGVA